MSTDVSIPPCEHCGSVHMAALAVVSGVLTVSGNGKAASGAISASPTAPHRLAWCNVCWRMQGVAAGRAHAAVQARQEGRPMLRLIRGGGA